MTVPLTYTAFTGCRRFAALRSIVVCFLEAVPLLVSVAAMLFFFLFIFAGEPS